MRPLLLMVIAAAVGAFARALLEAERKGGRGGTAEAEDRICQAVTKSGSRCTRPAEPGSDTCWQHGG